MNVWERLMFRKIEAWLVMLLVLVLLCGSLVFGYLVLRGATGGSGAPARVAVQVAGVPTLLKQFVMQVIESPSTIKDLSIRPAWRYFDLPEGMQVNEVDKLVGLPGTLGLPKLLRDGSEVYVLYDLATGREVARWPMDDIDRVRSVSFADMTLISPRGHGAEDSGDGLVKVARDGSVVWEIELPIHHRITIDSQGTIYTPIIMPPHPVVTQYLPDYRDDGYAVVSADGKVLDQRSVTQILLDNDLGHLLFGVGALERDGIHLNAVRVAEAHSKYWKRGDVLMSIRHLSMLMLYRPSTNRVVWYRCGPWLNQHDPVFVSDHEISVFNNNVVSSFHDRTSRNSPVIDGQNQVIVYDFETDSTHVRYAEAMRQTGLVTVTGGRQRILADGSLIVSFEDRGLTCVYRADDQSIHYLARVTRDGEIDAHSGVDLFPQTLGQTAARPTPTN